MLLPQILRGSAIMFCLLPPTRLALGHFPPERVADASGLFNLMRNLGGAIGLALIDTVIYGRAPILAERLVEKLKAGDIATGRLIGLPEGSLTGAAPQNVDPETISLVRALVEKTALVHLDQRGMGDAGGLLRARRIERRLPEARTGYRYSSLPMNWANSAVLGLANSSAVGPISQTLPRCMNTSRLATRRAKPISCVTSDHGHAAPRQILHHRQHLAGEFRDRAPTSPRRTA